MDLWINDLAKDLTAHTLAGNRIQLNTAISRMEQNREKEKAAILEALQPLKKLEAEFEKLGLGKHNKEIDLSSKCLWVPANIKHEVNGNHSTLVYGGVRIAAHIQMRQTGSERSTGLLKASFNGPKQHNITTARLQQARQAVSRSGISSSRTIPSRSNNFSFQFRQHEYNRGAYARTNTGFQGSRGYQANTGYRTTGNTSNRSATATSASSRSAAGAASSGNKGSSSFSGAGGNRAGGGSGGNGNPPGGGSGGGPTSFNRDTIKKGFQDHHIISPTNKLTRDHELLKLAGFDLESRANKIFLPSKESLHATRSPHLGRHTTASMKRMEKAMDKIVKRGKEKGWTQSQYNAALTKLLKEVRQELKAGNISLNKNARPWANNPNNGGK